MKNIADVDSNFKVETKLNKANIKFFNSLSDPIKIHGIYYQDGKFRRLPETVAEKTSHFVHYIHAYTTGGRIRFKTDSSYVAIKSKQSMFSTVSYMTLAVTAGFDMYVDKSYFGTFVPPYNMKTGYESLLELGSNKMREITINFPLYSEVEELYIGLEENAELLPADDYTHKTPVVFYGSSITHGACASRPGNSYPNIISRRFDIDFINLGFSGCAKAEDAMAEYIAGLDMSIFVFDYDHNAPDAEYLKNTHEKMFKTVRAKHPDLPIIMMTSPSLPRIHNGEFEERKKIVYATYKNALESGDKNVYFIDGEKAIAPAGLDGTIEGIHPNDLGFHCMARAVGEVVEKII